MGDSSILLCLSPLQDAISFQQGFLGYEPAKLVGEVQCKISSTSLKTRVERVTIEFRGQEQASGENGDQSIELHSQRRVLWDVATPTSSSAAQSGLPSTIPFALDLTADLPHCIHLASSSLGYTLTATVHFVDNFNPPATYTTPIHLVRYGAASFPSAVARPSQASSSSSRLDQTVLNDLPCTIRLSNPIEVSLSLQKTSYRRIESIPCRVRIPPPASSLMVDKALSLRSVSVELWRSISVLLPNADQKTERTLICRSGKSCRFSPTRSLSLLLTIPPRFDQDLACESITQTTILHDVQFYLRLTVTLTSCDPSDRQQFHLERPVGILPDLPISPRKSEKQREAETDTQRVGEAAPVYEEVAQGSSAQDWLASLPTDSWVAATERTDEDELEYDGYEESMSAAADAVANPPPPIESDVSPPAMSDDEPSMPYLLQAGYLHFDGQSQDESPESASSHDSETVLSITSSSEHGQQLDTHAPPPSYGQQQTTVLFNTRSANLLGTGPPPYAA